MAAAGDDLRKALHERRLKLAEYAGSDTVVELTQLFQARTPALLATLREAVRTADVKQVQATAHALKGSSANIGATEMSKACAELETLARAGGLDNATALVAHIDREYEHVLAILPELPPLPPDV